MTRVVSGDLFEATCRVVEGPAEVYQRRGNEKAAMPAGFFALVADVPEHCYFSAGETHRTPARTEMVTGKMYHGRAGVENEERFYAGRHQVRFFSNMLGD